MRSPKILAVATQGTGGDDELRLKTLLREFEASFVPFSRGAKLRSFARVLGGVRRERPEIVVIEGTGIAGGAAVLLGRLLYGTRYVLSSGDAIAPFVRAQAPLAYPLFLAYEYLLCRHAAGFVGWSPYLAGRALSMGSPTVMTAPGWAPFPVPEHREQARYEVRTALGIPEGALVFGLVGSLAWNRRVGYCYGLELARALPRALPRDDLHVVIVGDGAGRKELATLCTGASAGRLHLTGRVPRAEIPRYLAAMDLVTLPQSVDGVGSFRYTTKLSEYLSAEVPVVTNKIPLAYDLPGDWAFALPGAAPWDPVFIDALAKLMREVTRGELELKRAETKKALPLFQLEPQVARFTQFLLDCIGPAERGKPA
jgi:glycosyltransferase involved in cell wall biosynthesis